jgi:D-threo-aldose 1-dehydrogenase
VGGALMERRPVGRTGLEITRIGFGSAPIGDLNRAPSDTATRSLLQSAWDAGVRYFDTAPMYGAGLAERRVGDFLRDKPRDDYVLSSKVGRLLVPDRAAAMARYNDPRAMPFRSVFDFTYAGIVKSYEQSLQRLGLERIDILLLHDLGRFSQGARHDETWAQATEGGGIKALMELRDSGAIRAIGAGVNEAPILEALMDRGRWDVFLLANRYTLLDQAVLDGLLPRCAREGVSIVDGAPLHSGLLVTGAATPNPHYDYAPASPAIIDKVRRIEALCRRYEVPLVRAALTFPLGHERVAAIIPGFAQPSDFEQNIADYHAKVPDELWAELKREGLLHPDAPAPVTPVLR